VATAIAGAAIGAVAVTAFGSDRPLTIAGAAFAGAAATTLAARPPAAAADLRAAAIWADAESVRRGAAACAARGAALGAAPSARVAAAGLGAGAGAGPRAVADASTGASAGGFAAASGGRPSPGAGRGAVGRRGRRRHGERSVGRRPLRVRRPAGMRTRRPEHGGRGQGGGHAGAGEHPARRRAARQGRGCRGSTTVRALPVSASRSMNTGLRGACGPTGRAIRVTGVGVSPPASESSMPAPPALERGGEPVVAQGNRRHLDEALMRDAAPSAWPWCTSYRRSISACASAWRRAVHAPAPACSGAGRQRRSIAARLKMSQRQSSWRVGIRSPWRPASSARSRRGDW
jgi:hypothetical protein